MYDDKEGFIYSTDRYIDDRILVSAQVYRNPKWCARLLTLLPYIKAVEKVLKIKPVEVRFASLRHWGGFAYEPGRHMEIDIKGCKRTIKETIAHEAVHLWQMQTKRFITKNGDIIWEGKMWHPPSNLKGYEAYMKEPHEIEAYKMDGQVMWAANKLLREGKVK